MIHSRVCFVLCVLLLVGLSNSVLGQDAVRNAQEFSDEDYKRYKKTLIDRPAWEQLQSDFGKWVERYPLKYSDGPVIHLLEGVPVISLYVKNDEPAEVWENRRAGITRICKLVFKNKRYDEVHVSFLNKDDMAATHTVIIEKSKFIEHYKKQNMEGKLKPSERQSIKKRSAVYESLVR